MKNLILVIFSIFFFGMNTNAQSQEQPISDFKVKCIGDCGSGKCGLEGVLGGGKDYVQCKCDKCEMEIEVKSGKLAIDESFPNDLTFVMEYLKSNYKGRNFELMSIEGKDTENIKTQLLVFEDQDGKEESVMIARYANSTAEFSKGKFIVDCKGSCDCRERFYPGTGGIECTCNDCQMEVTEIKEQEFDKK